MNNYRAFHCQNWPQDREYLPYRGTTFQRALVLIQTRLIVWLKQEINPNVQRPNPTYFEVSEEDQQAMIQNRTYLTFLQSKRLAQHIMHYFNVSWMNMKKRLELNELLLEPTIPFTRSIMYVRTFQNLVQHSIERLAMNESISSLTPESMRLIIQNNQRLLINRSFTLFCNAILQEPLNNITTFYGAIEDAARRFERKCYDDTTIRYSNVPPKSIFGQTMFAKAKHMNYTQRRQARLLFQTFNAIINTAYHHLRTNYDRLRVLRLDQLTLKNSSHDRLIPHEHFNQRKAALDQIFQRKPTDQRVTLVTIDDTVLLSEDMKTGLMKELQNTSKKYLKPQTLTDHQILLRICMN